MNRKSRNYLPLGYKLMLSYSAFIVLPIALLGYIANSVFVGSFREHARSAIQGTLQQIVDNIEDRTEDFRRVTDMLYFDDVMADHLRQYDAGWVNYAAMRDYMRPKFRTALDTLDRRMWLSFYFHNLTFEEIYSIYYTDPLETNIRPVDWYHITRIYDRNWYKFYPPEEYGVTMQWKRVEDDEDYGRISLLRRIVDISQIQSKEIGFLRLSVYMKDLFESVDYEKVGEGTGLFVTDETGRVVRASGQSSPPIGQTWTQAEDDEHIVIQQALPIEDWKLTALIPKDLTDRDTNKLRKLTLLICLACFAVFSVVGYFISRFFSRRVGKIVSVLDSFQGGEFHKRIQFRGNDEFTRISAALNEMGLNIGNLIREVYITNLKKKEAELESLQAQINPHFLYNTLSSISRLAKFGQVDKLHQMVLDLAKFYRLSLNDGKNVITVFKEIEQAKAYIDIQKTKYADRMHVHYDIDPAVFPYETLKLILQPFIENVLQHGWCGDRIHIRITGTVENGTIVFQVIDDGIGFRRETLRQIFEPAGDDTPAGYGIRNVDQRIKLHYGQEFGVTIASRPGVGATVRIVIPAID
ncbi:histidine kinase/DNA gyrase B/HSP90-like ATPase [Cohnella sp. SGD-V74]|uniref:cache domain-containing sensor histidine kinase n=1 Tax=unclassified Cohnella TaxID=2636738 RepID=UPI000D408F16|nr:MULTISPECIES: sensor histidine kinase [unclassified Cohnella]PRX62400.1 histidine kinase/DNA gyrase B/HSP90-like ATPase [Cohnella sp. SGD-V74]